MEAYDKSCQGLCQALSKVKLLEQHIRDGLHVLYISGDVSKDSSFSHLKRETTVPMLGHAIRRALQELLLFGIPAVVSYGYHNACSINSEISTIWTFSSETMDFVVDRVSEDSFFENLLLGLPKILDEFPCITDLQLSRFLPVQHNIICAWEQKYSVLLPEDVRSFYGSTDGLLFSYKYDLADGFNRSSLKGKLEINSLNDLIQINGYEISTIPGVNMNSERYALKLGAESKVFILETLENLGKVVLVYINSRYFPNIWVQTEKSEFYFLSDDFTTYLRMSIYHMGIPYWQFAYTESGIPDSSKMLLRLMAPSIIPSDEKIEHGRKQMEKLKNKDITENILNKIDVALFKTYYRTSAPNAASIIEQTNSTVISKKKTDKKSRHLATVMKRNQSKKQ